MWGKEQLETDGIENESWNVKWNMFLGFEFWQRGNSMITAMLKKGSSGIVMDSLGREQRLQESELGITKAAPSASCGGLKKSPKVRKMQLQAGSVQKQRFIVDWLLGIRERERSRETEGSGLSYWGRMVVAGSLKGNGWDTKTNLLGPSFL